jgi:hypothetical protein
VVRARQGARQARLPARRSQRVDRRAAALSRFTSALFGKRIWLVLGLVASAALVALIVALVLTRGESRRDAVAAYIDDVNHAQLDLQPQLRRIDTTYRRFSLDSKKLEAQQNDLAKAEAVIRRVRTRVAALDPPDVARRLHAQILEALALEASFAHDIAEMALALPRYARENTRLTPALIRARNDLKDARTPAQQDRALAGYAAVLRTTARGLEQIDAPAILKSTIDARAARLQTTARVMDRLRRAVKQGNRAEATQLNRYLARTSREPEVTQAQHDAVVAYNRRLRAISLARAAVERERQRLDRTLG